jgi:hypothetical protein
LRSLAAGLAISRLVLIWVFGWYLMRSGYSLVAGGLMIGAAVYLTLLLGGNALYSEYPFVLPTLLTGVAASGMALSSKRSKRWLPVVAAALGFWAAFLGNLRTSHYPIGIAICGLFLAHAARTSSRRVLAVATIACVGAIVAFQQAFIRPFGDLRTHHVIAHPLVLGLANPPNDLSRREGIEWDDAVGLRLAKRVEPNVTFLGPTYDSVLLHYYVGLWRCHPREMARLYWRKMFVTGDSVFEFLRSTREGPGIGLFWTEKNGAFLTAAASSVELPARHLTLGVMLLMMFGIGISLERKLGLAWTWPAISLGLAGALAFLEAAIILGSVALWYSAVLIFSVVFEGLLVLELLWIGLLSIGVSTPREVVVVPIEPRSR